MTPSSHQQPQALLLPTDTCPHTGDGRPVHPYQIDKGRHGGIVATYRCPQGHGWRTSWAADAVTLPCPGCPTCPAPSPAGHRA